MAVDRKKIVKKIISIFLFWFGLCYRWTNEYKAEQASPFWSWESVLTSEYTQVSPRPFSHTGIPVWRRQSVRLWPNSTTLLNLTMRLFFINDIGFKLRIRCSCMMFAICYRTQLALVRNCLLNFLMWKSTI